MQPLQTPQVCPAALLSAANSAGLQTAPRHATDVWKDTSIWCTTRVQIEHTPGPWRVAAAGKGASSGIGFAIPVDTVKGLVDQILQYGRVMRPSLGIVIAPPQALQRIGEKGVLVLDVSTTAGSSACRSCCRFLFLVYVGQPCRL